MSVHHGGRGLGHLARVTEVGAPSEPSPPVTSNDFENGEFLTPEGPVTFEEMFTDFDGAEMPDLVPGVGLVVESIDVGVIQHSLALVDPSAYLAGCVLVVSGHFETDADGSASVMVSASVVDVPTYQSAWEMFYGAFQSTGTPEGDISALLSDYGDIFDGPDPHPAFPLDGEFKVSARLAPEGLSISCNGDPAFTTAAPAALDGANTLGFTFGANGELGSTARLTVRSLQVYEPDAYGPEDLSGLSSL